MDSTLRRLREACESMTAYLNLREQCVDLSRCPIPIEPLKFAIREYDSDAERNRKCQEAMDEYKSDLLAAGPAGAQGDRT